MRNRFWYLIERSKITIYVVLALFFLFLFVITLRSEPFSPPLPPPPVLRLLPGGVSLAWDASTSAPSLPMLGYKVYRTQTAGVYASPISNSLILATTYTDSSVIPGQTYYYSVTAYDPASSQESVRSNEVQAVIPNAPIQQDPNTLFINIPVNSLVITPPGAGDALTSTQGIIFYSNGDAAATFNVIAPGPYSVYISAQADIYPPGPSGSPIMEVWLDTVKIANFTDIAAIPGHYIIMSTALTLGIHKLTISFPNDYYVQDMGDRNLYVLNTVLFSPVPKPPPLMFDLPPVAMNVPVRGSN